MNMICRCGPRRSTRLFASDAAPRARSKGNDPTGTMPLQRRFEKEMNRRWDGLRRVVPSLVNQRTDAASTIEHAAITGQDPVRAFQSVFDKALKMMVVGPARGWMLTYVRGAGDIAIARASDHVQTLAKDAEWNDATLVLDATPQRDRIPPLQTLAHSELQGIAEAVSQQAVRAFAQGLLNRETPGSIGRAVQAIIDKVGKGRSSLLVSFVIVRAFSAVTLDAFRAAGVGSVGVKPESASNAPVKITDAKKKKTKPKNLVEVLTAGDDDVCPVCEQISEEGPYTLDEAELLIPAHPRCRCAFVPWHDKRFAKVQHDADFDESKHPRDEHGRWSSGHNVDQIKKFLDDQPTLPAGKDFISNKSIGIPVYTGLVNLPKNFSRRIKSQPAVDVNLSDIVSGQNYLQKSKILSILSSDPPTTPIVLVRQDDKLIMTDGNHRLASAKLRGDKTIKAVVIHAGVTDSFTHTAAGIMFLDPTGRALFVRRADSGDHAGEWCFPGGAIEPGETAEAAARREALEEVGYSYTGSMEVADRRTLSDVDFTTFVAEVPKTFRPRRLDAEHTDAVWRRLDNPPEPLHPGVRATIDAAVIGDAKWNEEDHPRDKDGKWTAGDPKDVKHVMNYQADDPYTNAVAMNTSLREGDKLNKQQTKMRDAVDRAIEAAPPTTKDVKLYRGTEEDWHKGGLEKAFFSATSKRSVAEDIADGSGEKGTLYEVTVPKGSKMLDIGAYAKANKEHFKADDVTEDITSFEKQYILPRNAQFKRGKTTVKGGRTIVQLTYVPPKTKAKDEFTESKHPGVRATIDAAVVGDAKWNEEDHPRDENGRFTDGSGSDFDKAKKEYERLDNSPEGNEEVVGEFGLKYMKVNVARDNVDKTYQKTADATFDRELTKDERKAISSYQKSKRLSEGMNAKLRSSESLDDKQTAVSKHLDAVLDSTSLKQDHTLYRGLAGKKGRDLVKDLKPGDTFTDKGYMSTSLDEDTARGFSQGKNDQDDLHVMRILADKGQRALLTGERSGVQVSSQEYEAILPRNTTLKFRGKSQGKFGTTYYDMVIVKNKTKKTKTKDEFTEALHPRDKDGKFATKAETSVFENKSGALDFGSLKKVGEQKGSNAGGVYQDVDGDKFYVKSMDESHAKNERLAASLYALTGAPTLEYVDIAPQGDKHFVATKFETLEKDNVSQFTPVERKFAQKNFATHAWLANWDAAGTGGDNQGFHDNQIKTLDVGGALEYRAQGAPKGTAFGTSVDEFNTLRDPKKNKDAAALFGDMTNEQIKQSAEKVVSIPDHVVKDTVLKNGGTAALADKLIARKNDLNVRAAALDNPKLESAIGATPTTSTTKTPHDYIKSVKGTSAERIEWRKQLKETTDPVTKKELQNKILASFKKQHDKSSGDKKSEIAANITKYSKMYKVPNPLTTSPVAATTGVVAATGASKPVFGKAEPKPTAPQSSSYTPTADDLPSKYASFTPEEKQGFDDLVRLVNGSANAPLSKYDYKGASSYVDHAAKRLTNMKYYGTDGGLTAVEAAHIVAYSGSQYRETNSALRAGKMTEAVYKHTEALDGALSKLPGYVGTVYRKANLSSSQAAKYEPGHVIVEHAFTSTSKKEGVWSGDYRYVIEARGKRGHDIEKLSSHGGSEAEVLYQSGSKFLVTKREGNKIYMREL